MAVTLLVLGFLMVGVLVAFALVVALLKFVLMLVLLPLRLGLKLALLPVKLVLGVLLFPLALLGVGACGLGLFAASIPMLPFAIVALAVWVMVRRGKTARAI
ncbi:MAG: hypothetical protein ACM3NQ_12115 [Bacteroidales bacterium]